ncbi:MAG TPA: CvpA family protein, partial [Actinomycetes bacterium]|nr:CvpA family protein [Actinomycetes bacterium]
MNGLDVLVLIAAVSFAYSGYRQGFVVGVLAFTGFLAGGVGGLLIAPALVSGLDPGLGQSVLAIAVVLLAAAVGQACLAWLGSLVRDRLTWRPVRVVDAGMGALVSVVAMLVVTWFLASALRPGPVPAISRQISDSRVITAMDDAVPDQAHTLFSSFRRVLDDNGLPTVFGGLDPEKIRPVDPPSPGITSTRAVRSAGTSVVKVVGTAEDCSRRLDGTGFVMSERHVMTNAHVVAGV